MKIILATCGSRGDVQPMIALCLALKEKGHDALLIGPPEKTRWAKQLDCPYQAFGKDVTAFIDTMKNVTSVYSGFSFLSFLKAEIQTQFKELPGLVRNADLIIASSLMFSLSSIAQALQIPYRYIAFTPQLFPSSVHPFLVIRTQTMPCWMNQFSWKAAKFTDRLILTRLVNRFRKEIGLDQIDNTWEHILGSHPILASDRQIAAIPDDVNMKITQTGFLHLKIPCPENPALESFLEKGSSPVYAGFGSMPPNDQKKCIPLLIHTAKNLGIRMIIARFWKDSSSDTKDKDIFFISSYPHLHLFPRMSAIIHHGGAGTTAAAALSGVPQIIVPHILDQYYHGQKIYTSHLGSKPIWRSRLTVRNLTAALNQFLSSPDIRQAAAKTGLSIDPEKSMRLTIKAVEQSLQCVANDELKQQGWNLAG